MFEIRYIMGNNNNPVIQHYFPSSKGVQIANAYQYVWEASGQEYIVAVWRIKLKEHSSIISQS